MWQGLQKSELQREADRQFVAQMVNRFQGDVYRAARYAMELGWRAAANRNPETALRRFNQAWLISPNRKDIPWGFAVATGMRGDDLSDVEKWFVKSERLFGPHWHLYSDWGRVLQLRDRPKLATPHFLKSIALNPNNPEPHIGMIMIAIRLGDKALAEKHERLLRELRPGAFGKLPPAHMKPPPERPLTRSGLSAPPLRVGRCSEKGEFIASGRAGTWVYGPIESIC